VFFHQVPVRLNSRRRVVKSVFKTYIDAVHVKKTRVGQIAAGIIIMRWIMRSILFHLLHSLCLPATFID
jgi:hypothetical protein